MVRTLLPGTFSLLPKSMKVTCTCRMTQLVIDG